MAEIKTLEILIATVVDRRHLFEPLLAEFERQAKGLPVDISYMEDNKEISIGRKRQLLLEQSKAHNIVFFDSDDFPRPIYIPKIMEALERNPDCVGFLIGMTTNGKRPQTCCHSLQYPQWAENKDGYDFVRNVTHFNPIRRYIANRVGFPDKRFGEDKPYADRVTELCRYEVFIPEILFDYRYSTHEPHNKKYGITN